MSPSDEDSQTFTVNAANGEIYKLKGPFPLFASPLLAIEFSQLLTPRSASIGSTDCEPLPNTIMTTLPWFVVHWVKKKIIFRNSISLQNAPPIPSDSRSTLQSQQTNNKSATGSSDSLQSYAPPSVLHSAPANRSAAFYTAENYSIALQQRVFLAAKHS
jgi:hypothetical protein